MKAFVLGIFVVKRRNRKEPPHLVDFVKNILF